jgi:hypothetical protein
LSDDTVPVLLESLPQMNFEGQCVVKRQILQRLSETDGENDFRTWNFARWKARRMMIEAVENFDITGCPAQSHTFHNPGF